MRAGYRQWLEAQGYHPSTVSTQCSSLSRIERHYGDLEEHLRTNGMASVLATLQYSSDDDRRGRPNPSRLDLGGNVYKQLAFARSVVAMYTRFLNDEGCEAAPLVEVDPDFVQPVEEGTTFGLELDLQMALRGRIESLEPGLEIADGGSERVVASGRIDITARDAEGTLVVVELKAGTARQAAVGQILSYMGDIAAEEERPVRGILVAAEFDAKARAAARMVPALRLRRYAIEFRFDDGQDG